jgi:hypothetical protein
MSRNAEVFFDWADGAHTFRLPIGGLRELQEKTGVGPYALFRRLTSGDFRVDDAREVIRIGLIHGGKTPLEALELTRVYIDDRPLLEAIPAALRVLGAALMGPEDEPLGNVESEPAMTTPTTASGSQTSSEAAS